MRWALVLLVLSGPALAQSPAPSPAHPPAAPADPKAALNTMLSALRAAPNEQVAKALEDQIRDAWAKAASPAVRLLLTRGARELEEGAAGDATDSFDAALDLDPTLLEAWRGRAQARLRGGDSAGAIRDIQEVLRREPRDFAALQDLSHIAEAQHDWKGALSAWQKVLDLDPKTPDGRDRLQDLRRRALGDNA